MLFLYLMAKAAFYGRLTERQKEKGVFKSNNAWRKDSAAALPRCEWNKQLSRPPTLMISQANCLLCGPSGGNNCVFSLFGSLPFSHIWKYPQAVSRCTGLLFELDSFKQHSSILQGSHDRGSMMRHHRSVENTGDGSEIFDLSFFFFFKYTKDIKPNCCAQCMRVLIPLLYSNLLQWAYCSYQVIASKAGETKTILRTLLIWHWCIKG